MAAQAVAAVNDGGCSGGHQRRTDQRGVVAAPDLLRGAIVEDRHEPGVHAQHAEEPRRRHVALGERELDVIEGVQVHLVAAPAPRLQHAEEAGLLHFGDSLGQDLALFSLLGRALGEHRNHRPSVSDQVGAMRYVCLGGLDGFHCAIFLDLMLSSGAQRRDSTHGRRLRLCRHPSRRSAFGPATQDEGERKRYSAAARPFWALRLSKPASLSVDAISPKLR
jgi:hypothetical protein